MKIKIKVNKFVTSFLVSLFVVSFITPAKANAGHLIPAPCDMECRTVDVVKIHAVKKHRVVKHPCKRKPIKHKRYKHYRRHVCTPCQNIYPCMNDCGAQHEIVEFIAAPAPSGCYVNLEDCGDYVPDRITGDDDPMVYPGMNIDR